MKKVLSTAIITLLIAGNAQALSVAVTGSNANQTSLDPRVKGLSDEMTNIANQLTQSINAINERLQQMEEAINSIGTTVINNTYEIPVEVPAEEAEDVVENTGSCNLTFTSITGNTKSGNGVFEAVDCKKFVYRSVGGKKGINTITGGIAGSSPQFTFTDFFQKLKNT